MLPYHWLIINENFSTDKHEFIFSTLFVFVHVCLAKEMSSFEMTNDLIFWHIRGEFSIHLKRFDYHGSLLPSKGRVSIKEHVSANGVFNEPNCYIGTLKVL